MKKTTYIIIVLLAISVVAAFFLPRIIFTERDTTYTISIIRLDSIKSVPLDKFSIITYDDGSEMAIKRKSPDKNVYIEVIESQEALRPIMQISESWLGNVKYDVEDGTLHFSIDFSALKDADCSGNGKLPDEIVIAEDNFCVAKFIVPSGMIKTIAPRYMDLTLSNFQDADVNVNSIFGHLILNDCQFRRLTEGD